MHIHFEKSVNAECDCTILSMSWMGKVPDELPEDEGWKLNRTHYYQEGWLATGNVRGILGVTFTTSHWRKNSNELPLRTNYNLRGHRAQITLVQWNEPYQKLASCDSSGIIFVWIKYEGRWSIELINDRSTPVTHFSWSHDGRMALICYQDGFVLVGSVAGQRYWSSMLNLDATITCGIWTPDDQQVYFGTSNAQVIVMDVHGAMVSQVQLPVDSTIRSMAWSCEKFKMEENEEGEPMTASANFSPSRKEPFILAVAFKNGLVYLMKNYDDIAPIHIWTGMQSLMLEWSNSGEYLAVAGSRPVEVINEAGYRVHEYFNSLYFYNHRGVRVLNIVIPATTSPVTALTWGHNDKRLFVATGKMIHVGWVSKRVASLQLLCRLAIYKSLSNKSCVAHLPLPLPVRALISSLHTQTILSILPNLDDLREFVCHPPSGNLRLYCTMIRHEDDANQSPGTAYTLYLEYLGGLIPILKGKRTSKIRPEFVIYDPQSSEPGNLGIVVRCNGRPPRRPQGPPNPSSAKSSLRASSPSNRDLLTDGLLIFSDSSESEDVELCASPHMQRRRYRNRIRERERERLREQEREWERSRNGGQPLIPDPVHVVSPHQLIYTDVLPESMRLVEVTSNIWGTKFKIHGLASSLPDNLGQVTYKTSLLHLQPRQMTLLITELRDDIFLSPDSVLNNPNYNQDDEEDMSVVVNQSGQESNNCETVGSISPPPVVAPASRCFLKKIDPEDQIDPVDPNDDQDEFPYVDLQANPDMVHFRQALKNSLRGQRLGSLREPRVIDPCPTAKPVTVKVTTTAEVQLCEKRGQSTDDDCPGPSGSNRSGPSGGSTRSGPSSGSTRSSIRSPTRISWTGPNSSPSRDHAATPGPSRVNVCPTNTPPPIYVRRSFSASYLDSVEHPGQATLDIVSQDLLSNTQPKRLVLVKNRSGPRTSNPKLKECGKSKSWDSHDLNWWRVNPTKGTDPKVTCPKCSFPTVKSKGVRSPLLGRATPSSSCMTPPTPARRKSGCYLPSSSRGQGSIPPKFKPRGSISEVDRIERASVDSESDHWTNSPQSPPSSPSPPPPQVTHRRSISLLTPLLKRREQAAANKQRAASNGLNPQSAQFVAPGSPQHHRSQPTTPNMQRKSRNKAKEGYRYLYSASSPIRQLFLNSPLFPRKNRGSNPTTPKPNRKRMTQETQTLDNSSDEEDTPKPSGLSSFRTSPFVLDPMGSMGQLRSKLSKKKIHVENSPIVPRRMQFVMHNKAPMWNENSQVYQLDFGGRVTQESAKNFQIEFRGKQVMQFGRIDGNAYTLDFQYPFSALQAFAVALANVTQRLK